MKRILFSVVVLLIFFSCPINCFASKYEEPHTGNVYAKVNYYANPEIYTADSDNSQYVITTDDGTQITVHSNNLDLVLVIHQITKDEKESYEWFESCVAQSEISFIPYDIFFLNASGERIELSHENEIAISPSNSAQYVLGLSYEGTVTDIPYSIIGDYITFTATDTSNYYLLCKSTSNTNNPQTGDTVNVYTSFLILIINGALLLCSILYLGKKRTPDMGEY